jgi:hypothetical protein
MEATTYKYGNLVPEVVLTDLTKEITTVNLSLHNNLLV